MSDYRTHIEHASPSALHARVEWKGSAVPIRRALELLRSDRGFRLGVVDALRVAPFSAYFWETPSVSRTSPDSPFAYVLTDAPSLDAASPEPDAFGSHFASDADLDGVVTFRNLGGDATLVVPCPVDRATKYVHLASFVRTAPEAQVDALFAAVGAAAMANLTERPQWLSTAGMGVHWLHVRIDARPKYYRFEPYKKPPPRA